MIYRKVKKYVYHIYILLIIYMMKIGGLLAGYILLIQNLRILQLLLEIIIMIRLYLLY